MQACFTVERKASQSRSKRSARTAARFYRETRKNTSGTTVPKRSGEEHGREDTKPCSEAGLKKGKQTGVKAHDTFCACVMHDRKTKRKTDTSEMARTPLYRASTHTDGFRAFDVGAHTQAIERRGLVRRAAR